MKTGIQYLKFTLDKDNKCPMLFDTAEMLQMETMDEFSQWLAKEEYILGHLSSTWRKRVNNSPISMSVLYQMFLKSKEA